MQTVQKQTSEGEGARGQHRRSGPHIKQKMVEISPHKKYIQVNVDYMPDGRMIPRRVTWDDGHAYDIDKVTDQRRAASLKAGGTGIRYTCRVGRQTCHLFYEDLVGRWFVELK